MGADTWKIVVFKGNRCKNRGGDRDLIRTFCSNSDAQLDTGQNRCWSSWSPQSSHANTQINEWGSRSRAGPSLQRTNQVSGHQEEALDSSSRHEIQHNGLPPPGQHAIFAAPYSSTERPSTPRPPTPIICLFNGNLLSPRNRGNDGVRARAISCWLKNVTYPTSTTPATTITQVSPTPSPPLPPKHAHYY